MSVIEAGYFDGKSSVKRPVGIVVSRGRMKIIGRDLEQEFDARLVRRSLRIANTPRWLYLPGGGTCVTSDNAAVDRITRERRYERVLHKWESRPAYAALAVALVVGILWLLVDRGVPVAVEHIAEHIPVEAEATLGRETLRALDERVMRKSTLPGPKQNALRAKFTDMARAAGETTPHTLEFRESFLGANAFALPPGSHDAPDAKRSRSRRPAGRASPRAARESASTSPGSGKRIASSSMGFSSSHWRNRACTRYRCAVQPAAWTPGPTAPTPRYRAM